MWWSRRSALVLGGIAVILGLAACVPVSEPPRPPEPTFDFAGMSVTSSDHSVALRNLYLADPGPDGYQVGSAAPLFVQVWNNTTEPISLVAATARSDVPVLLVGAADGGDTPPAEATFDVLVGPGTSVPLSPEVGRYLQIGCVSAPLASGDLVEMTFTFSNDAVITTTVPVGGELTGDSPDPIELSADC